MKDNTFKKYCLIIDEWFVNGFNSVNDIKPCKKYYVYLLINPLNKKIFYIGKGKGDRVNNHQKEVEKNIINNGKKFEYIKEILSTGEDLQYHIFKKNLKEDDALTLERKLINRFKNELTNIQSGRLTQTERNIIIAKNELKNIKPFYYLKYVEKRSRFILDLYLRNENILKNIAYDTN
jgi:hypothetical protein